jgi:hypothetical protein
MTCFDFQNRTSDYLDGTLTEPLKRDADDHLAHCKECSERQKHFRTILAAIASQPKLVLPPSLKKDPLSSVLPKNHVSRLSFSRWQYVPWYLRTLIEGTGIVALVLLCISSAPKIRSLYETNIEKSLNDFRESSRLTDTLAESVDPAIPPLQGKGLSPISGTVTRDDDLSGEDEESESNVSDIRVGRSQLWRFTLKTVSPDELRPQVVKALTELGLPSTLQGLGGVQVPGGIEFDLVVPQSTVANLKHALEKLTPRPTEGNSDSSAENKNFSWYRVKSKRKLSEDKSQVVIWLAQPSK